MLRRRCQFSIQRRNPLSNLTKEAHELIFAFLGHQRQIIPHHRKRFISLVKLSLKPMNLFTQFDSIFICLRNNRHTLIKLLFLPRQIYPLPPQILLNFDYSVCVLPLHLNIMLLQF